MAAGTASHVIAIAVLVAGTGLARPAWDLFYLGISRLR